MQKILCCLLIIALSAPALHAVVPTLIEERIGSMNGTKAGTDTDGNLWFWNAYTNVITHISTDGSQTISGTLPKAVSADVDTRRGIVLLTDHGQAVQLLAWDGRVTAEFALSERAGDIAWLKGSLVAVTPLFAPYRIAVWNTETKTRVRTVDPCIPISNGPGTHVARATLVRYDAPNDEMLALDATFGRIFVFTSDGHLVRDARLRAEPTPIALWLSDQRNFAYARHTILIWRFSAISIARDGTVWIGGEAKPTGAVTLFRYGRDGIVHRVVAQVATCPTSRVHAWHDMLLFFRDPQSFVAPCTAVIDTRDSFVAEPWQPYRDSPRRPVIADQTEASRGNRFQLRPNATAACSAGPLNCACECADYNAFGWPLIGMGCECTYLECTACNNSFTAQCCTITCTYSGY